LEICPVVSLLLSAGIYARLTRLCGADLFYRLEEARIFVVRVQVRVVQLKAQKFLTVFHNLHFLCWSAVGKEPMVEKLLDIELDIAVCD